MDNKESVALRRKRLLQEWAQLPPTREVLNLLRQRYPALLPSQLAPSWEAQHKLAGQQQVMADLTRLAEKGEL